MNFHHWFSTENGFGDASMKVLWSEIANFSFALEQNDPIAASVNFFFYYYFTIFSFIFARKLAVTIFFKRMYLLRMRSWTTFIWNTY